MNNIDSFTKELIKSISEVNKEYRETKDYAKMIEGCKLSGALSGANSYRLGDIDNIEKRSVEINEKIVIQANKLINARKRGLSDNRIRDIECSIAWLKGRIDALRVIDVGAFTFKQKWEL